MAGVSVLRGVAHGRSSLLHQSQFPTINRLDKPMKLQYRIRRTGFTVFARYSQTQEIFTTRLQDRLGNLPKFVEDIVQTSINTGPRGALRLAQGVQAVIGVGTEWLADVSKVPLDSAMIVRRKSSMLIQLNFIL
nr:uncharacterized aarF domain-containing protein kinase At5g05200, chloroplastic [Ipomoea batatas]GMC98395.1 uncharacterized aarF domain-containing protein kinase At5g05200, chloroplastic [Ipomoea batatas]GMD00555.1 uncharacterized aarF domain-containing protein kinase At5g05200, chloroplastic [Ipomoea batatas]